MELHDYQPLALRTAPPKEGCLVSWKQLQLIHAVLGINGEIGEILNAEDDLENFDEEIGDTMWYVALAADAISAHLPSLDLGGLSDDPHNDLQKAASELTDHLKRHLFYKTDLEEAKVKECLSDLLCCLQSLSLQFGGRSFDQTLAANIAKLKARYPEKFSEEAAVNRNIKAETEAFRNPEA